MKDVLISLRGEKKRNLIASGESVLFSATQSAFDFDFILRSLYNVEFRWAGWFSLEKGLLLTLSTLIAF